MVASSPIPLFRLSLAAAAVALGAALPASSFAQVASPAAARLKADVSFLADDAQEGRGVGTKGIDVAADYIAAEFTKLGLKPAPGADGYFQNFSLPGDIKLGDSNVLAAKGAGDVELKAEKADFSPLMLGGAGKVEGLPLVFAGYGITAKKGGKLEADYDDYADLDTDGEKAKAGRAVLLLRRSPRYDKEKELFGGATVNSHASFRRKVVNAYQHGAKVVLLVNDLAGLNGEKDELLPFEAAGFRASGIPVIMISRAYADKLLAAAKQPTLEELEKQISEKLTPRSRAIEGLTLNAEVTIAREAIKVKNVIGVLEGSGPHADETVVVGAHYDHLGHGGFGSLDPASTSIHNGADDNASGTATVMEMARRLSKRLDPLPRRVVFMAFSGEERGLLGSNHYVNHPLYPLDKTVMMVNFDMVGRLDSKSKLMVYGTGTTAGIDRIVEALGTAEGFGVKKFADGNGGGDHMYFAASDHYSFYTKDIPVLFLFTGVHPDYHRPSDDADKVNYDGMARIADFGELLLLDLVRRPTRPEFLKPAARVAQSDPHGGGQVAPEQPAGDPTRAAYLGTVPDYNNSDDTKGVKLSSVTGGSPAEKGGMKGGDIVIKVGDSEVSTLEDYTSALQARKPGDKVDIVVRRGDKEVTLKVTLGARGGAPKS